MRGKAILAVSLSLFATASAGKVAKDKYDGGYDVPQKHHTTTLTCPDGFYLEGSRCISKQEVQEELSCPAGTIEENGQCLNYSPGRYSCPSGLRLVGKTCIGRSVAEKEQTCPAGSLERDGKCLMLGDFLPECPEGSVRENGLCLNILEKLKRCPEGFRSIGDLCVAKETAEPERFCPTGTIDNGVSCDIITEVEPTCPPNSEDWGSQCALFKNEEVWCPEGYEAVGSWCQQTDIQPKLIECANGGDPNDNCAQIVPVPLTPVCRKGKLWDGQCVSSHTIAADYLCPEGYLQNGRSCTRTTEYDCSTTEHDIVCEDAPEGKGLHLRMLGDAKDKYSSPAYSKRHNLPVCHKVPRTVPKICEKTISAQPEPYCTQGLLKAGNRCEIQDLAQPDLICEAESGIKGDCYLKETSKPLRRCPYGYTNDGSACTKTTTVAPEWSCPPGTEGPNCVYYVEKQCPRGGCTTIHSQPASHVCPEGFAKIRATGKCLKLNYADKELTCPVDTEDRDGLTCREIIAEKIRDFVEEVAPVLSCPEGFADNGRQCVRRDTTPADFVCARDEMITDAGCARIIPRIAACPKGATLLKDKCWVISSTDALTVDTVVAGGKQSYH